MSEFSEVPRKQIEIQTRPHDILIPNPYVDDHVLVDEARELIDVFPVGLLEVNPRDESREPEESRYYIDSERDPKFFLKVRRFSTNYEFWKSFLTPDISDKASKRAFQASNSLMNEIYMSSLINQAISEDPRVLDIVQRFGFSGIDLVDPIIGQIDKDSHEKLMVYRFAGGIVPEKTGDRQLIDSLSRRLELILASRGIVTEDLVGSQFLIEESEEGRRLHLVDIEDYYEDHEIGEGKILIADPKILEEIGISG